MSKPTPDAARMHAWEVFRSVMKGEVYSHIALPRSLNETSFDSRDKAFITEVVYGALRAQGQSHFLLSRVSDRPAEELDEALRHLLYFAIYQATQMRIPPHASVSANVELARAVLGESKGSYVNAVLRKIVDRSLSDWLSSVDKGDDPIRRLSILHSHPQWIVSAYMELLPMKEVEEELVSNNKPARPTLVAWPGRSTVEELLEEGGERTPYSPYGVISTSSPNAIAAIRERRAGVQDEGSQLVASLFMKSLHHPSSILDACAGPGGKAALISSLALDHGVTLVANEISDARAQLVRNVVVNAEVKVGDARKIQGNFDAILCDVPCTGIGALRRRPEVRWRRTPQDLNALLPLQREIVEHAVRILNPGGILGYATCSPHLKETRGIIDQVLAHNGDVEEIEVPLPPELSHARSGKSMQLWGHSTNTDAMFLALLRKKG